MSWPLFWVERTGAVVVWLRRFVSGDRLACPARGGYHHARTLIGQRDEPPRVQHGDRWHFGNFDVAEYAGDGRWPMHCECGYEFVDDDDWQVYDEAIYVRRSTGEHWRLDELPIGATFDAFWQPEQWRNAIDGMAVTVVLPHLCREDLDDPTWVRDARSCCWNVDGPATGKKNERKYVLHAWTRSGDPRAEPSTLSASPSIDAGGCCYHGHVQHGMLTDAI